MRPLLNNTLARLLPAMLVFPVALAAAPLCTDCPTAKVTAVEKSAHACCDKTQKLSQGQNNSTCASCCVQAPSQSPVAELKADVNFVGVNLPPVQQASVLHLQYSLPRRQLDHLPERQDATFLIQLNILI